MAVDFKPGDVLLGKYRIEHVLGQGGMGMVVAARHVDLGQLFAIKFLLDKALAHAESMERFLREARSAASLTSEHVAKVMDVGRLDSGAPYMIMEHLSGSDLGAVVRDRGPLPPEEAVGYVLQVCDALAEAHAKGIIHRDLKPANLFLIRRANGSPCVKVLDFGISKQIEPGSVDLTNTSTMLGSPLYMSPEQMLRSKGVDVRTDIWALGVVLYELVTGKVPFPGESVTEVVASVLQGELARPSSVRAEVEPNLDAVIVRCLEKKPEERFASIDELAAALRPIVGLPSQPPVGMATSQTGGSVAARTASGGPAVPTLQGATSDVLPAVGAGKSWRVAAAAAVAVLAVVAVLALRGASSGRAGDGAGRADPGAAATSTSTTTPTAISTAISTATATATPTVISTATTTATSTATTTATATATSTATPTASASARTATSMSPGAGAAQRPPVVPPTPAKAAKHEGIF